MNTNVDQMHARRGPNWNRWRRGMILAAGGTVSDPKLLGSTLVPASSSSSGSRSVRS
jgi:hypothetical protein